MFSNKKYKFVLNDNYKRQNLPSIGQRRNVVPVLSADRIRHIIGNYYYEKDGDIAFHEPQEYPFEFKLGKTVAYDRGETDLPLSVKITPVSLTAKKEVFGPYPTCTDCWQKYIEGEDGDGSIFEVIYDYPTLQMRNYTTEILSRSNIVLRTIVESDMVQRAVDHIASLQDPILKIRLETTLLSKIREMYIKTSAFFISHGTQIGLINSFLGPAIPGQSENKIENLLNILPTTKTIPNFARNGTPPVYTFLSEQFREILVTVMEDVYFKLDLPVTNFESEEFANRVASSLSAEVDFQFNYEAKEYNSYLEESGTPESRIANVYAIAGQTNLIPIILGLREDVQCLEKQIIAFIQDEPLDTLLVTGDNLGPLNNFYPFEFNFPHYARIKFDKQKPRQIASTIQEQELDGFMLRHLSEIQPSELQSFYKTFRQIQDGNASSLIEESVPNERLNTWSVYEWMMQIDQEIFSLQRQLQGVSSPPSGPPGFGPMPQNTFFFGNRNKSVTMAENDVDYYTKLIRFSVFTKQIQDIIKDKNRSYRDILKGVEPHQEVVAYKIEKYQVDDFRLTEGELVDDTIYDKLSELGNPIQTFWFFNSATEDVVEYVDTQIKFNTQYTYVVKAYKLVVGSRYFYLKNNLDLQDIDLPKPSNNVAIQVLPSSNDFLDSGELVFRDVTEDHKKTSDGLCKHSFLAVTAAQPLIYEMPYFIASGKANNSLPIAPDVQFIPYKGIDDEILINFNSMEGEYRTQFVVILDSDQEFYDNLKNQRELDPNELLLFEDDDDISAFEAFRLDYHPFGFEDFKKSFYRKFSTILPDMDKRFSNSFSLLEKIEPNRKYYYMFRTIDSMGQISNPSRIFEVEIINDGGAIYPYIRNVDFRERSAKQNTKDARRIVMISPTILQSLQEPTQVKPATFNGQLSNVQLGIKDEVIWGKTYKMRITSSKTGRKIDINIRPKVRYIESPNDDCGNASPLSDALMEPLSQVGKQTQEFFEEISQRFDSEI